jgi:prophage DNA circulation protein
VEFFVDATTRMGGRRIATHEIPNSEKPPIQEDLGAKGRLFPTEAFVFGAGYQDAREALAAKLDAPGSGELVHPAYGTRRVVVTDWSVRETRTEGGVAQFSIDFVETSDPSFPESAPDPTSEVATSVGAATEASSTQFLSVFERVSALNESVTAALQSVADAVEAVGEAQSLGAQELAALKKQVNEIHTTAAIMTPAEVVDSQVALFQSLADGLLTKASGINPVTALLSLFDVSLGDRPPATTPNRAQEQANFDAIQNLSQRLVVVQASKTIVEVAFASYDDAVASRSEITDKIDAQIDAATDDTFQALTDLRASLVRSVPGADSDLPRLQEVTLVSSAPSLVWAHRLYGSIERELDLVSRNHIRNPLFVPAVTPLEALIED